MQVVAPIVNNFAFIAGFWHRSHIVSLPLIVVDVNTKQFSHCTSCEWHEIHHRVSFSLPSGIIPEVWHWHLTQK